jgi:hypothetical protein
VRNDKVSTKIRSIFDVSSGKPLLNSCLETEPNQIQPLFDVMVRFRHHRIALSADVEKAFLQIRSAEEDLDWVRFIWVDDPFAVEPKFVHYRWKSVVSCVTTSPFLLMGTIRHHALRYNESHPETVHVLLHDMYMDDLISGVDGAKEVEKLVNESVAILQEAGLPLSRWLTNDAALQEKIAPNQEISESVGFSVQVQSPGSLVQSKVLSLVWNRSSDCFGYDTQSFLEY